MKRDLGSPLAPTFGGGDLKKRLAKRKARTEAKVERKNIKSAGKNQDAKNKGYDSQADKNKKNLTAAERRLIIRKNKKKKERKGPNRVSTSTSTSTSNREGDKNRTTVTVNKNKTTIKKDKKEEARRKKRNDGRNPFSGYPRL
tara:strand:+ start:382 stop:810 length:429 start_codon:yes stop_codon:yes gene_type:complete